MKKLFNSKIQYIAVLFIILCVFMTSACKNSLFPEHSGKGKVLPSLENISRTIFPDTSAEGLTDLILYKSSVDDGNKIGTWANKSALSNASAIELETGTYTFVLTAKIGSLIFKGTVTDVAIEQNKTATPKFNMQLDSVTESTIPGTLEFSIDFPVDDIFVSGQDEATVALKSLADDTDLSDEVTTTRAQDGSSVSFTASLPAGQYLLTVEIKRNGGLKTKTYSEVVIIAAGANSSKSYIFGGLRKTDVNPIISTIASESQDFIFNTDSVGFTTITIRRSEWNKMLAYYDYFYKNENSVIAESYEYEKDGKKWQLENVGLRLRGNTSRFRPQGKDFPVDEVGNPMPNAEWSKDYYNYAASCDDNDYRQSHFKIDFEPFDDDDRKLSDCMKSVALKRSDGLFSKEIFCYNLFHLFGIWTAPRASQTHVDIKIIEDISGQDIIDDVSDCEVITVNYGVYEMFEEVNKQSLKGRMKKNNNNQAENAWANNSGDLWKCAGGDLTTASNLRENFGVEQVEILNTDKDKSEWIATKDVIYRPCYDLKTNKTEVDRAADYFQGFVTELNELSNSSADSEAGITARKTFYEKWFDVDFFIKTYAVNMLVGMDDDYWGNANNYYLYFDNGKDGSGKCYLIPFDYDNTLGASISGDKVISNPFKWGFDIEKNIYNDRPLMDRLIEVPEYREKLKATLLEVSSQDPSSPWNKDKCIALWNKWHAQVRPYVSTPDIKGWPNIGSTEINDDGGWKEQKHYLTQETNNIYEQTTLNFRYWLDDTFNSNITFNLNGGAINGEEVVVNEFKGNTSLTVILGETPVRTGYNLLGWTKTKDGDDFVTVYNGEENLTLYAKWMEETKFSKTITSGDWGVEHTVTLDVEATADGLRIRKEHDASYKRSNIEIKNITTGITLVIQDNVDGYNQDTGAYNPANDFVYPFVDPDTYYEVKIGFQNENYGGFHDYKFRIKSVGGRGEFYVDSGNFEFNKYDQTITFDKLNIQLPESVQATDSISGNHTIRLWTDRTWGDNIITSLDPDGTVSDWNWWDGKWKIDESNPNVMRIGLGKDLVKRDFANNPAVIYAVCRYEYTDKDTGIYYYTDIIYAQVYKYVYNGAVDINFDLNGGSLNGDTGVITRQFTGNTSLNSIVAGTPTRNGFEFIGWTKTKDGNDYTSAYKEEKNLTVYARWVDSTKAITHFYMWRESAPGKNDWHDVGLDRTAVIFDIEPTIDGLKIHKEHDDSYKRSRIEVTNIDTRIRLIILDNIDGDYQDNSYYKQVNDFVYPFVDANNSYEIKLCFWDDAIPDSWHEYYFTVDSVGGAGEFYADASNEYEFDKETQTITFKSFSVKMPEAVAATEYDRNSYHFAGLFNYGVWNDPIKYDLEYEWGTGDWGNHGRWKIDETNPNKIQLGIGPNLFNPEFPENTFDIYAAVRLQYNSPEGLYYYTDLVNGKIY